MTIDINYGKYTLFDIEYYITQFENSKDKTNSWHSELSSCTRVKGISKFLQDKLGNTKFDVDEFIRDSEEIQELRGWLWEKHSNNLTDMNSCSDRHYHVFKPELDQIIDNYCKNYGFTINID